MLQTLKRRWLNPLRVGAQNLVLRHPPPRDQTTAREHFVGPDGSADGAAFQDLEPHPIDAGPDARELFLATIPDGRIYGPGVVITPDNLALEDVFLDFGKNTLRERIVGGPNLPQPRRLTRRVVVAMAPGSGCYFHWLFDILPRINLLGGTEFDLLYIDHSKKFQRDYLRLVGISDDQILPYRRRAHYQAAHLIVPSLPGYTGRVTAQTCEFLRSLLPAVGGQPSTGKTSTGKRKIYITRSDAQRRRIVNESDVWQVLQHSGFERVSLSTMSVAQQIRLFASAEEIVAPHGAGLSNLVFCQPGTHVIEIAAPNYVKNCFRDLAAHCHLGHSFLVGEAAGRKQSEPLRQDIRVEPSQLSVAQRSQSHN
jgi:capsular polysaccharide biosynthesis protein